MAVLQLLPLVGGAGATAVIQRRADPTLTLTVPTSAPANALTLDGRFQGYSIEFPDMTKYCGNLSNPNKFSYNILQNLKDWSGSYSILRAGGSDTNVAIYDPNLKTGAVVAPGSGSNGYPGTAKSVSFGPSFYESFKTMPSGTQYIYGLNYRDNSSAGHQRTVDDAARVVKNLGRTLYSFQLGNEVTPWYCKYRPCDWNHATYTADYLKWMAEIGSKVFGSAESSWEPIFQAGMFPASNGNVAGFNAKAILQDGIAKTGKVNTVVQHEYMGTVCSGRHDVGLRKTMLNHTNTVLYLRQHRQYADYAVSVGVNFALGETNSISCGGATGISDVFGAALWALDYALYTATTSISKMYFHQGSPYKYASWVPETFNGKAPEARPIYYGQLMMARALSGGQKKFRQVTATETLTTYAIYTSGKLTDIAIVNLDMYNSTETRTRPQVRVVIPEAGANSRARRLTAPGAEVTSGIKVAGRTVAGDGTLSGADVSEPLTGGAVYVKSSEAVLVTL